MKVPSNPYDGQIVTNTVKDRNLGTVTHGHYWNAQLKTWVHLGWRK